MSFRTVVPVFLLCGLVWFSQAEEAASKEPEWLAPTITLGPAELTPSAHFNGAIGASSGDPGEFAVGHHDPTREDGTVQGIELGMSLRAGPVEGYAVHNFSYGAEEKWDNGWEEAFLKLKDIPGGFEVRGGRMFSRFGRQNAKHLHAWDFADMPLVWGRFLGDDGLILDGADATWLKQGISTTYGITVGYGEAKAHAHDHGEEEHHDDDDEHDPHGHDEEVLFSGNVGYGRAFTQYRRDDFNAFETGASLALGEDEADRQLAVFGADFSYTWRENGLEPGGRALTWLTEVLYRTIDNGEAAHEDHDDHGDNDDDEYEMLPGGSEWGLYSQVVYTHNQHLDTGLRLGYIDGDDEMGSSNRLRVSPALTTYLDDSRRVMLRLQYNYDDIQGEDNEHSVWLQAGLTWGGPEVR